MRHRDAPASAGGWHLAADHLLDVTFGLDGVEAVHNRPSVYAIQMFMRSEARRSSATGASGEEPQARPTRSTSSRRVRFWVRGPSDGDPTYARRRREFLNQLITERKARGQRRAACHAAVSARPAGRHRTPRRHRRVRARPAASGRDGPDPDPERKRAGWRPAPERPSDLSLVPAAAAVNATAPRWPR